MPRTSPRRYGRLRGVELGRSRASGLHVGPRSCGDGRCRRRARAPLSRGCRPGARAGDAPCRVAEHSRRRSLPSIADADADRRRRRDRQGPRPRRRMARTWRRSTDLLACYGVGMPDWRSVTDPVAAGHAAVEAGGRVALKAAGPAIVHKTDLDAVRVGSRRSGRGLMGRGGDGRGAERRRRRAQSFIVQSMVEGGAELLVGVVSDPVFGPVLACGAGGTRAELIKDVAVRICPLTAREADEAIGSLAIYPLLTGFRGAAEADLEALQGPFARGRRHGRRPSRDRRARPQPRDGGTAGRNRSRREDPGRGGAAVTPWPSTWKIDED